MELNRLSLSRYNTGGMVIGVSQSWLQMFEIDLKWPVASRYVVKGPTLLDGQGDRSISSRETRRSNCVGH